MQQTTSEQPATGHTPQRLRFPQARQIILSQAIGNIHKRTLSVDNFRIKCRKAEWIQRNGSSNPRNNYPPPPRHSVPDPLQVEILATALARTHTPPKQMFETFSRTPKIEQPNLALIQKAHRAAALYQKILQLQSINKQRTIHTKHFEISQRSRDHPGFQCGDLDISEMSHTLQHNIPSRCS